MKYGLIFATMSVAIIVALFENADNEFMCLWLAATFATLSLGYFGLGGSIFGKRPDGTLRAINVALMLPYLLLLWVTWHGLRRLRRNAPYQELTNGILIGRRLLPAEFPPGVASVFDLACEFVEPRQIRRLAYHSCPVLDGAAPNVEQLLEWARLVLVAPKPTFIHCAEGHGRTGLLAATVLIEIGDTESASDALRLVQSKRPSVRLQRVQMKCLEQAATRIHSERIKIQESKNDQST